MSARDLLVFGVGVLVGRFLRPRAQVDETMHQFSELEARLRDSGHCVFERLGSSRQCVDHLAVLLEDSKRQLAALSDLSEQRSQIRDLVSHGASPSSVCDTSEATERDGSTRPVPPVGDSELIAMLKKDRKRVDEQLRRLRDQMTKSTKAGVKDGRRGRAL